MIAEVKKQCRSPQGERGLKQRGDPIQLFGTGRSPQGERGLKLHVGENVAPGTASRSPQGERGLKLNAADQQAAAMGRSPQGERGLKRVAVRERRPDGAVAPRKGSVG